MKRQKWRYNTKYDRTKDAVGENVPYFEDHKDYEIGYNWTRAKKYRSMRTYIRPNGYIEYFYGVDWSTD